MTRREFINDLLDFLDKHGWNGKGEDGPILDDIAVLKCSDGHVSVAYYEFDKDGKPLNLPP